MCIYIYVICAFVWVCMFRLAWFIHLGSKSADGRILYLLLTFETGVQYAQQNKSNKTNIICFLWHKTIFVQNTKQTGVQVNKYIHILIHEFYIGDWQIEKWRYVIAHISQIKSGLSMNWLNIPWQHNIGFSTFA